MRALLVFILVLLGGGSAFAQCTGPGGVPFNCKSATSNPGASDLFLGGQGTNSVKFLGSQLAPGLFSLVPTFSGGGTANFLRADGAWAAPAAGTGSPGGNTGQIQYNNAGLFGGLTNTQLTADINVFSSTLSGAVPASGGGTTTFLRADGTFATPAAGGITIGGPISGGINSTLLYQTSSGTLGNITLGTNLSLSGATLNATGGGTPGGSTGQVQYNNAGTLGGLTNGALTALINQFTTSLSGAVPTSPGGTTQYLRADGTWQVPSGTGTGLSSVGLTMPAGFAVSGSPLTANGTIGVTLTTQTSGYALISSGGVPAFRALVSTDLPTALQSSTTATTQTLTDITASLATDLFVAAGPPSIVVASPGSTQGATPVTTQTTIITGGGSGSGVTLLCSATGAPYYRQTVVNADSVVHYVWPCSGASITANGTNYGTNSYVQINPFGGSAAFDLTSATQYYVGL